MHRTINPFKTAMSNRHNDKDEVLESEDYEDETEFEVDGLTYDVNFDDLFSDAGDDEEDPWIGRGRHQSRDRMMRMRDNPVPHDDYGDDWDDNEW